MADREVSWGDAEEEVISLVSTPATTAPVATESNKSKKRELKIPEWSVDTRGDLPLERALRRDEEKPQKSVMHTAEPSWPEETTTSYAPSCNNINFSNSNYEDLPPLTRRPGRDSHKDDRSGRNSNGNPTPRNGIGSSSPAVVAPLPPKNKKRIDDFSTLNLPGVDLSKMPQATTRLSFTKSPPLSSEDRQPQRQHDRDLEERVERVTREVEDLSWGEHQEESMDIIEPVHEPVRVETAPAARSAPVVVNSAIRLDCDGWGDEPEEPIIVQTPSKPEITKPVTVKSESVKAVETVKPESVKAVEIAKSEPVKVAEIAKSEPVKAVDTEPLVTSPGPLSPPPHHQHMMMSAYPPQYMMNHPMSPIGQMPMMPPPMSAMPGMMMPVWVTCPFCYHCYMYPPIVPQNPQNSQQNSQQNA